MKICSKCGTEHNRNGGYCHSCHAQYYRDKRKSNPAQAQKWEIKKRYKLDYDKYLEMVANGCYVCGSLENLVVDHDHSCCSVIKTCGKCVRGILCKRHNIVLGILQDSASDLRKLLEYLLASER